MHRVEIRLTNEGFDQPSANFEIYTESLKDGSYVESAPMRLVAGGGSPIVLFLEDNERVAVVAKANTGVLVYDKDQNANVRVETDEEKKSREQREANVAKSQADQAVRSAHAKVGEAQESAKQAEQSANAEVKKAEADAAKVQADQAKNRAAASEAMPAGAQGSVSPAPRPNHPGNPASANTGPRDSKQVKP